MSAEQHAIRVTIGPVPAEEPPAHAEPQSLAVEPRTPLIDIHEGPEGLVLEADLPGVIEQNLNVQLQDNVLTLEANVEPALPEVLRPLYLEFQPSAFNRSFILSDEVDKARISAELKDGVLRLNLPRAERSQTRRIEVKS